MGGPLAGLRILDFTRLLPGPFGGMVLGDLGAEIVRVDSPNLPDLLKVVPPMQGPVSAAHRALNRNKKSIFVDLKNPKGSEVIKKMVANYDIVIEQFRPGVMDRLGVGYETLKKVNPKVIYCSITGYGQDGPYRDRAGHDINYLALSGVMDYTGRKESGPVPLGIQVADQCSGGLNAVVAILAAVIERENSGEGQYIDISMTDGAIGLGVFYAANFFADGPENKREENLLNGSGYYDFYETKDGEYMSVGSLEPQFYAALCDAFGRDDLKKLHMAMGDKGTFVKDEIKTEFMKKTKAEWTEHFKNFDACVEPVISISEMTEHPNTLARNMVVDVETESGDKLKQIASPYKFSRTPCVYNFAGGIAGAYSSEILLKDGFSEDEVKEFKDSGAVQ
jgi:alpha-methylacyl-CoA racemase